LAVDAARASHTGDSGVRSANGSKINAGRQARPYITRQPPPFSPPIRFETNAVTPIASMEPIGRPICISAPPLPRCFAPHVSATSAAPAVQVPPIPRPPRKRSTATQVAEGAKAMRQVNSE
jgi:hypothetical protein